MTREREQLRAVVDELLGKFSREVDDLRAKQMAEVDALLERHAGVLDRILDRAIAAVEKRYGPEAAALLRAEFSPIREAMGKRANDILKPH
jgi:hypothetical protein